MNKQTNRIIGRGFTLVELAIVLVVIGLLLGMAFKGKSLVDAARIKAEVNKIQKISTAINVYFAKYGTLPGQVLDGSIPSIKVMYEALIKEGLKESDFKSVGAGGAGAGKWWTFTGCSDAQAGNNKIFTAVAATSQANICLYRSSASPKTDGSIPGTNIKDNAIDGQILCQMETLLDDKNVYSGEGRATMDPMVGEGGLANYDNTNWDCTNKEKIKGEQWWWIYRVY